jgi:hypothetical protein
MAWESSTDIFGRLDWLTKKTKNLLGRVYALENNTLRVAETTTTTTLPPEPPYKVYTALLTQSGDSNILDLPLDLPQIEVGKTYLIVSTGVGEDWTLYGAINNNPGTRFVATGVADVITSSLQLNTGAPVVKVLENTIGNIWFKINGYGDYNVNSSALFTASKLVVFFGPSNNDESTNSAITMEYSATTNSVIPFRTFRDGSLVNDQLINTPIEIRVYPGLPSFTLSSTEFTTFGYAGITPNGLLGWTGTGTQTVGREFYEAYTFVGSKAADIQTFFTDNGLLTNRTAYIFNVIWGAGSSITSGKVMLGFESVGQYLFMSAVYTGDNNWQTPGQEIINGGPMATAGTFNLPATFTLYSPTIANSTSWC